MARENATPPPPNWRAPRISSGTPPLCCLHYYLGSSYALTWLLVSITQLYLWFPPDDPTVSVQLSACLSDISAWMKEHHLQLNLSKTELLVIPTNQSLHHDIDIKITSSSLTPSKVARNLGVIPLCPCCIPLSVVPLYSIHHQESQSYLTQSSTQHLVQAMVLSRLDHCSALLAGLPLFSVKPGSPPGFQSAQRGTCHSAPHWPTLATHGRPNQNQDTNGAFRVTSGAAASSWTQSFSLGHCVPPGNVVWHHHPVTQTVSVQTVLFCGSPVVEWTSKFYQRRGVPLCFQESLEHSSPLRAPPFLKP